MTLPSSLLVYSTLPPAVPKGGNCSPPIELGLALGEPMVDWGSRRAAKGVTELVSRGGPDSGLASG